MLLFYTVTKHPLFTLFKYSVLHFIPVLPPLQSTLLLLSLYRIFSHSVDMLRKNRFCVYSLDITLSTCSGLCTILSLVQFNSIEYCVSSCVSRSIIPLLVHVMLRTYAYIYLCVCMRIMIEFRIVRAFRLLNEYILLRKLSVQ